MRLRGHHFAFSASRWHAIFRILRKAGLCISLALAPLPINPAMRSSLIFQLLSEIRPYSIFDIWAQKSWSPLVSISTIWVFIPAFWKQICQQWWSLPKVPGLLPPSSYPIFITWTPSRELLFLPAFPFSLLLRWIWWFSCNINSCAFSDPSQSRRAIYFKN